MRAFGNFLSREKKDMDTVLTDELDHRDRALTEGYPAYSQSLKWGYRSVIKPT